MRQMIRRLIAAPRTLDKRAVRLRRREMLAASVLRGSVCVLGDSIVEECMWPELTGLREIQNCGISGDCSIDIWNRLPEVLVQQPRKIVYLVSSNDAKKGVQGASGASGAPIASSVVVDNIILTFQQAQRYNVDMVVVSPLPTRKVLAEINTWTSHITTSLAAFLQNDFIDIRAEFMDSEGFLREDLSYDGRHLNILGYQTLAHALSAHFK